MQLRLLVPLQLDGFGSDSVRLVRDLRRDAQQPVQFLLFSATFNERIKSYALRVTADDGKEEVNQVWPATQEHCCALSAPSVCIIRLLCIVNITMMHSMQVFVPREDLSLDVIKQYQVVSTILTSGSATAQQDVLACCVLIQPAPVMACMIAWSDSVSMQECPTPIDKVVVLEEMIFPQCEKLGQTIIFVRTREIARTLHAAVSSQPPASIYQSAAG